MTPETQTLPSLSAASSRALAGRRVCLVTSSGLDPGGGGGGGPNAENRGAKFLCLKGKGRTISLFLHQKCFNVNSSGHKEP